VTGRAAPADEPPLVRAIGGAGLLRGDRPGILALALRAGEC